jgi:hypothetical protein
VRHPMFKPALVAAGLAVAAGAAVGTADAQAAAHPAAVAATAAAAQAQAVFLITGNKLLIQPPSAPPCVGIVSIGSPVRGASSLRTMTVGGVSYAFPAAVMPYLGHGLDPSLFNVGAVAAAETGRRLPVRVAYSGRVPSLPGVTITGASGGVASGYLTAAGAARFGAALAHLFTSGRISTSHGLFGNGVSVALPGARSAARRPKYQMETVTVTGTNWAGKPDNGGSVYLFNTDDSSKFDNPFQSIGVFKNGVAKFSVPVGHYWAVGDFVRMFPTRQTFDEYLDFLPQFTIGKATTVQLSAKAATSELQMVTAKKAMEQEGTFQVVRDAAAGPAVTTGWLELDNSPNIPAPSLFVSPTTASPSIGKLATATTVQLGTATFPMGSKYLYDLAFQSSGTIPAQRHVISQASLATLHVRYYSAVKSWGLSGTFAAFPFQAVCPLGVVTFFGEQFPTQQTEYVNTDPALAWETQYILSTAAGFSGGEVGQARQYLPGQRVTDDLGAYPLHPAPNYLVGTVPAAPPAQVSASRAANTLRLAMTAFSDSVPGHTGQGTFRPAKAAGSYSVIDNGRRVAGGTLRKFFGQVSASAPLSRFNSFVQFTLKTSEAASVNPLSTATDTTWSWESSPPPAGARVPAGWTCLPGGRVDTACSVEPVVTLRYGVVGESLGGTTSPGPQVIKLSVGHLQLAKGSQIVGADLAVSFDGGKTWHPATITGSNGSYAASFSAPADSLVSLRTTASDANGSSVTETITNAYQVAYQG